MRKQFTSVLNAKFHRNIAYINKAYKQAHFWARTPKKRPFDSLNRFSKWTDSLNESDFPHRLDGGGGRGGTSWTKRGFKRVYDFRVEPSHSVSQWTRAHCDNRPHCVRFRLGSKTERDSVQKIAPKTKVCPSERHSLWAKKDRARANERDRRWEQWCWLKFCYYEQGARIVGNPLMRHI